QMVSPELDLEIWSQYLLAQTLGRPKRGPVSNGRCPTRSKPNQMAGRCGGRVVPWRRASSSSLPARWLPAVRANAAGSGRRGLQRTPPSASIRALPAEPTAAAGGFLDGMVHLSNARHPRLEPME